MDPVTIISGATVAFNALKKGFAVGKDLQEMGGQLNQWASAMSDLGQAEKKVNNPPWWKSLGSDVEQEAMAVWNAKRKAEAMREELRSYISFVYGPSAWDEIVSIEAKMRKQRKEAIYAAEERKQAILEWIVGIILAACSIGVITFVIWLIGMSQGRW